MYRNVVLSPAVYFLLLVVLAPSIFAHEEPKGVVLYQRQITPAPSHSAATYTTTSASSTTTSPPNEILEAVNITLDGQLFPPPIYIEGITTTT